MNEPNAQGQQPGAEIPVPENQTQQDPQAGSGVQGRIDELTREKYEAKARADAAELVAQRATAEKQELILLLSQQAAAQAQQVRPAQDEFDSEQQRLMAAMQAQFAPVLQGLQKQSAQLAAQLGLTTIQTQVQGDQRVKQRATEIAQNYAQRGLIGQFTVADLQDMAEASILREDRARASNKGSPAPGLLVNATPSPRVQQNPTPQGHPVDLERWSLADQEAYWLKRLDGKTF